MRLALLPIAVIALILASCTRLEGPRGGPSTSSSRGIATPGDTEGGEIDPRFVPDLKRAFLEYKAWGRVDDELRWAPFLCRLPEPGRPTMSTAPGENGDAHAKKLYSLFARDHESYVTLGNPNTTAPPKTALRLQIVAKESYIPELVENPAPDESPNAPFKGSRDEESDHFVPFARGEDGRTYRAGKLAGVYFVIETASAADGATDEGFIYGTVTPSGEVTSAGRVASCMGCHVEAKYRRFFGPRFRP